MDEFDGKITELSAFQSFACHVADILVQPGYSLWTPWMSKNLPNACEWVLFLLNSALWGFGSVLLVCFLLIKRKSSRVASLEKPPSS
jgi:hypothetical protein